MIKFINSWAQGIILAVIIATIVEIILPEGKNKKYVKTVIGIYILFTIIYPLINKFSKVNINSLLENTTKQMSTYEESNTLKIDTNKYIEDTYRKKVEEDLKNKANEQNLNVISLNINIETQDEKRYGMLNSLVIEVEKENVKKTENTINQIKEVNVSKNAQEKNETEQTKENTVTQEEINELKEYINTTYYLEKEKIHINE